MFQVDHFLLILHLVWTKRVLTMKRITTVFSAALTILTLSGPAWCQLHWASPNQAPLVFNESAAVAAQGSAMTSQLPAGYPQVMPASFCAGCGAGGECGCDDAGSCGGACGGICSGGCGSGGGILGSGGLLGKADLSPGGGCWFDAEYLYWWSKKRYVPALVTTSPAATPQAQAGVLGLPTTTVLFGDELLGGDPDSGYRVSGGKWLNKSKTTAIGGRFMMVRNEENFFQASPGDPILARPFFDTVGGAEDAFLVAYPGLAHGNINITAENRVRGFDVYLRKLLLAGYCNRWDIISGYQNSNVEDRVDIRNEWIALDNSRIAQDSHVATHDFFEVDNQFHGGFLGIMASSADGRLSWNLLAKVAVGNMNQEATIVGSETQTVPAAGATTLNEGLLAQSTNIGSFEHDEFAIVPEMNVTVGYNVSDNFQLTLGYTFIYWSEVALAGDMIDTTINTSQPVVGPNRPSASLTSDGYWYTGLNFGASLRF